MTSHFFRSERILQSDTFGRGAWGLPIAGTFTPTCFALFIENLYEVCVLSCVGMDEQLQPSMLRVRARESFATNL